MLPHLFFGGLLACAFVLGLLAQRMTVKQLRADLKLEQSRIKDLCRELHHAGVSLARKDDEIDRLEAKLLEAEAELVLLRGNDPEAA